MIAVLHSLTHSPPCKEGALPLGRTPHQQWADDTTTLDDYRTRLENWEGALRAREWKLDWDIQAQDEDEADWERAYRISEWKRQERAEKRAAVRARVKAQREAEKAAAAHNAAPPPGDGPRIRALW